MHAGGESQTQWQAVSRTRRRPGAIERGLVLQAAGLDYRVEPEQGEYVLWVAERDAERAHAELTAYELELIPAPAAAPPEGRGGGWTGVLIYAAVLMAVEYCAERYVFDADWLAAGRLNAGLVRAGEWWRTFTALTLHADVTHLAANLVFGALFGVFAGRALGDGAAWGCIVAAAAAGNALNAAIQPAAHTSIGASTAVFATLGILTAHGWRWSRWSGRSRAQRLAPLLAGLCLLAYTGMGDERTDVLGHVTGFGTGVLFGAAFDARLARAALGAAAQAAIGAAALLAITAAWWSALT